MHTYYRSAVRVDDNTRACNTDLERPLAHFGTFRFYSTVLNYVQGSIGEHSACCFIHDRLPRFSGTAFALTNLSSYTFFNFARSVRCMSSLIILMFTIEVYLPG